MHMHRTHAWCQWRPEKNARSPRPEVRLWQDVIWVPGIMGGLLREQAVLFASEPSLQPLELETSKNSRYRTCSPRLEIGYPCKDAQPLSKKPNTPVFGLNFLDTVLALWTYRLLFPHNPLCRFGAWSFVL